jgi:hypothetical protein
MKALSLHLGLNYAGHPRYSELFGCHADVAAMSALALRNGWQVTDCLLDHEVTTHTLDTRLAYFAAELEAGDRLLLTYSGHGGQRPDLDGDEADGDDETWCLWDGDLVDDAIGAMLARFKPGIRVAVVSDSCHSGTVFRGSAPSRAPQLPDPEVGLMQASVMLFSGCTDEQVAGDLSKGGQFTVTMLDCLAALPDGAGWRTLEHMVLKRMPRRQQPRLAFAGTVDTAWIDERPFAA